MSQILIAKRAIRDHWSDWTTEFSQPPQFDVNTYQERLNTICGKSRGEPIMKLEWGGNATMTKYTEWDSYGTPTKADIVPRFALTRAHEFLDLEIYIPIKRWIISERMEAEQLRPDDNSDNSFTNGYGVTCIASQKPKSFYTPYIYVGDHSKCAPNCCEKNICLGDYKLPTAAELDYLLECTYKLQSERIGDPYSPLTESQMMKIRSEYQTDREKRIAAQENDFDYESRDIHKTIKHHLDDYNLKQPIYVYKDGLPV